MTEVTADDIIAQIRDAISTGRGYILLTQGTSPSGATDITTNLHDTSLLPILRIIVATMEEAKIVALDS